MMRALKIPAPLLEALLSIANDYMNEKEFDEVLSTEWSNREKAGPAWRKLNLCLQKVSKSPFPGPREAIDNLQLILAQYQLKFDGVKICKKKSSL
ncbi:MAG: hypothetical protein AB8G05_21755 [Oligoflexales bacterium]